MLDVWIGISTLCVLRFSDIETEESGSYGDKKQVHGQKPARTYPCMKQLR